MRYWLRAARAAAVLVTLLASLVACEPLPPPGPGSELIDCSHAGERVELTASAHLDPSCTYSGIDISTSGVTLDCQGARIEGPPTSGTRGILVSAPPDTSITDVTVRNCTVIGFLNSIRVTREGFRGYAEGEEYLTPTVDILIEDNRFIDSWGVGVYVDGYVEDVTIRGNRIDGFGSTGIYLETGSRRNRVEGNSIINGGYREAGPGGREDTFNGVRVWYWGVGREGLAIDGSYENVVVGNAFYDNSNGGIFLYKNCGEYPDRPVYFERRHHSDDNLIEGNTFLGGRNGVWVGSRMGENTLPMECTDPAYVEGPLTRVVRDHAARNVVRGNTFIEVAHGVRVEDDDTVVEGNTFQGTRPGLHPVIVGTPYRTEVLGEPVTGTVLVDNVSDVLGNTSPYRWVHGHEGTTVSGNTALGEEAPFCEGEPVPRQPVIFVIAAAPMNPDGSPPDPPADLSVPVLGELPPCGGT